MKLHQAKHTCKAEDLDLGLVPHEAEKLSSFPHLWGDLDDITANPPTTQISPPFSPHPGRVAPNPPNPTPAHPVSTRAPARTPRTATAIGHAPRGFPASAGRVSTAEEALRAIVECGNRPRFAFPLPLVEARRRSAWIELVEIETRQAESESRPARPRDARASLLDQRDGKDAALPQKTPQANSAGRLTTSRHARQRALLDQRQKGGPSLAATDAREGAPGAATGAESGRGSGNGAAPNGGRGSSFMPTVGTWGRLIN
ncbi:hypothetical protein BJ997_003385 [Cryobacterium roopkundense]|uniref:Uncharacterized protein n=1 Tax=Cryobacterium roopkundense TaxID=1001240 RepID=A0A7W8ZZ87_9MICO|nr:hypothetical protein [Cryobacterium roopkundense]